MATRNITLTLSNTDLCKFCKPVSKVLHCAFPEMSTNQKGLAYICWKNNISSETNLIPCNGLNETQQGSKALSNFTLFCHIVLQQWNPLPTVLLFSHEELISFSVAVGLLIVLSLVVNVIIVGTFVFTPRLQRCPLNFFAVNLAVSDILVAFLSEPIWMVIFWSHHYILGLSPSFIEVKDLILLQEIWGVFDLALLVTSLMNIAALAMERCIVVSAPHWYRNHVTINVTRKLLVIPWIYGFAVAGLDRVIDRFKLVNTLLQYRVVVTTIGFGFPSLLIFASYSFILLCVKYKPVGNHKHDAVIAFRILAVVLTFFILWSPFFIWFFISALTGNLSMEFNYPVTGPLKLISYLNSLLDPFVYVVARNTFRMAVKRHFEVWKKNTCEVSCIHAQLKPHSRTRSRTESSDL